MNEDSYIILQLIEIDNCADEGGYYEQADHCYYYFGGVFLHLSLCIEQALA